MADCLFCKIAEGKIPAKIVHQDKDTVAFEDINPQAPLHVLVIPRVHVPTMNDLEREHDGVMGKLFRVAAILANTRGPEAQRRAAVVPHLLHLHEVYRALLSQRQRRGAQQQQAAAHAAPVVQRQPVGAREQGVDLPVDLTLLVLVVVQARPEQRRRDRQGRAVGAHHDGVHAAQRRRRG